DRVACPWLIKRYIDKDAQFLYVPADKVLETAELLGARSYDAKSAEFTHQHPPEGEICSFVTLMRSFDLWGKDPALDMVGKIVNHADTNKATSASLQDARGRRARGHRARGFGTITTDDHQKLEWEFPMHDALYAFCQRKTGG